MRSISVIIFTLPRFLIHYFSCNSRNNISIYSFVLCHIWQVSEKKCTSKMSQHSELSLCNSYMLGDGRGQNKEAYDMGYSQAVTHPSINPARQNFTLVIGPEPVFSLWFGRRQGNHRENLLSYKGN